MYTKTLTTETPTIQLNETEDQNEFLVPSMNKGLMVQRLKITAQHTHGLIFSLYRTNGHGRFQLKQTNLDVLLEGVQAGTGFAMELDNDREFTIIAHPAFHLLGFEVTNPNKVDFTLEIKYTYFYD